MSNWPDVIPERAAVCDALVAVGVDPQTVPMDGGLSFDGYRTVLEAGGRPVTAIAGWYDVIVTVFHPWECSRAEVEEILRLDGIASLAELRRV